jgi:hypothetical protein
LFIHDLKIYYIHMLKYEVGNCLDNQLLFLQMRQSNMGHLSQCLLLKTKNPTMLHSKIKSNFFVWFASSYGHKQTSICDKNDTNCYNERFVGEISLQIFK